MSEPDYRICPSDITYILEHPWNITKREWGLSIQDSRKDTSAMVEGYINMAKEDGYATIWKTEEGHPIAILGGYKSGYKQYVTFFLASLHMEAYAMKISFDMRALLREKAQEYSGCKCTLFSDSGHPNQLSWFRFLGFTYMPERNKGKARYFEYISPVS